MAIFAIKLLRLFLTHSILLAFFCGVSAAEPTANKKVVFLSPTHQASPFFKQTISIMQTAATDLNLDLEVVYGEDLVIVSEQARELLRRTELPDYLVLTSLHGITEELMIDADHLGINILLFNAGIPPETIHRFRQGERPLTHWIGQILPDDRQAGRLVAEKLVDAARTAGKQDVLGYINLIAINGSMRSPASKEREFGLRDYVSEQLDVKIQQVIYTDWVQAEAQHKTRLLLQRFEDVSVVWTAADVLALGAAQALAEKGLTPGQDAFVAGVDWLPAVIASVTGGSVAGTVGGHSFDGAWALTVVYDHINGFAETFVDERTQFHWLDKGSVASIQKIMNPKLWQEIDFRAYTKTHNGGKDYRFGIERILESPAISLIR